MKMTLTPALPLAAVLLASMLPATAQTPTTPAAPTAPATLAAPAKAGDQLMGTVTAVDTAKKTITLTTRLGNVSKTLTLAPDAQVYAVRRGTVADLKAGATVRAYGPVTEGATTLAATRLQAVPTPAAAPRKAKAKAGFHKKYIEGTVAATTPALTMTTPGGVTVTVSTTPETRVTMLAPATLADVAVGTQIQARISGPDAAPIASEVAVTPARGGKRQAARGGRRAARTSAAL